tara:strand:- start:1343 stop:1444 length:102 start_codon:yes stop_codon:yes gene_type:complete
MMMEMKLEMELLITQVVFSLGKKQEQDKKIITV